MLAAADIAREKGFAEDGYRVVINTNADGGQTFFIYTCICSAGGSSSFRQDKLFDAAFIY